MWREYVPSGGSGAFEIDECGDEFEQTDALGDLAEHREPPEEIAKSAATEAHVARAILAALDGTAAPERRFVGVLGDEANGGTPRSEPQDVPEVGRHACAADPAEHRFGLIEPAEGSG